MDTDEFIKVSELRQQLGISNALMARLIREGRLPTTPNPYDRRSKVVRRADADRLREEYQAMRRKNHPVAA